MGMLTSYTGKVIVDDEIISSINRVNWQLSIGYVPQQIYLTDNSIAENIAFGVEKDNINFASIRKAARIAQLDDFIHEKLPGQYRTIIGENGVRLSGGQRQRIGIARALYHDPDVLILDEASSALDNITERTIINTIKQLKDTKTIIIIAHRLSTIMDCDEIIMLRDGAICAQGTYESLLRESESFKNFVDK